MGERKTASRCRLRSGEANRGPREQRPVASKRSSGEHTEARQVLLPATLSAEHAGQGRDRHFGSLGTISIWAEMDSARRRFIVERSEVQGWKAPPSGPLATSHGLPAATAQAQGSQDFRRPRGTGPGRRLGSWQRLQTLAVRARRCIRKSIPAARGGALKTTVVSTRLTKGNCGGDQIE